MSDQAVREMEDEMCRQQKIGWVWAAMQDMTDEELAQLETDVQSEIGEREKRRDIHAAKWAERLKEPVLIALGEAMLHQKYQIEPKTDWTISYPAEREDEGSKYGLGYFLADEYNKWYIYSQFRKKFDDDDKEYVLRRLLKAFDVDKYVFGCTHYDTCDNGHFYRMS